MRTKTEKLWRGIPAFKDSLGRLKMKDSLGRLRILLGGVPDDARWKRLKEMAGSVASPLASLWRLPLSVNRLTALILLALVVLAAYEIRTSRLQSLCLSYLAKNMTYSLEPGASPTVVFPGAGPFNERLGYTRMRAFQHRLEQNSFSVSQQVRFSPLLRWLAYLGITPPYRESPLTGLRISGDDLGILMGVDGQNTTISDYTAIPKLVVKSLLFIENRELDDPPDISSSPVLEWDRIAKAALSYVGNKVGLPVALEGGSTLVTQLEKYRYSEKGRTGSPLDKLRQLVSASLKVYRSGVDTRPMRQEIILDYLNTMPLSASPGYGEIHGLGEGLRIWFGGSLEEVCRDLQRTSEPGRRAMAFRRTLSLLAAVRAPTYYLRDNHAALERRVDGYTRLLQKAGIIDAELAAGVQRASPEFASFESNPSFAFTPQRKALNSARTRLAQLLGTTDLYDLDRLDLEVATTLDIALQNSVAQTFDNLRKREFLAAHGLLQERLLSQGDPVNVIYGLTLFERTHQGNLLRAQVDSYEHPLDFNQSIKLELGSTAKLRTLAHYLELVTSLYEEFSRRKQRDLHQDPISVFVSETLAANPACKLESLLAMALNREYSASPYEAFYTGGGLHVFRNYDSNQDALRMSVRTATVHSNNLVFIRLMRDLVRFHQERLEYNPADVLADRDHGTRLRLLKMIADEEARQILWRIYKECRAQPQDKVVKQLLANKSKSSRQRAILFFGLHGALGNDLSGWLKAAGQTSTVREIARWNRAYANPALTLFDYAFLLKVHPLKLWCADELVREPGLSWEQIWARSAEARTWSTAWLFQKGQRRAQNLRLSFAIERDAFARMAPAWRRLGFPYERLVPSLASAIGNSGDRPSALAELMGIILNDGQLRPSFEFTTLHFAPRTPYETVLSVARNAPSQVLNSEVARALREVLIGVVKEGTGRRLAGAFTAAGGKSATVGGKTGTGDNRVKSYGSGGSLISSRAVNRTASFVFFIEDRYYGVVTASVLGKEADQYSFTSSLPVAILRLLAPAFNARLQTRTKPATTESLYLEARRPDPLLAVTSLAEGIGLSYVKESPQPRDSTPSDPDINLIALPVDPSNTRWRRWATMVA